MTAPISSGLPAGPLQGRGRRVQRDLVQPPRGVHPGLDTGLVADLVRRHRRPAVGRVADEIVVGAKDLTAHDGQRLDLRQDLELLAHIDRRVGPDRLLGHHLGRIGRHPGTGRRPRRALGDLVQEPGDLGFLRLEDHDDIVVGEVAERGQPHIRAGPTGTGCAAPSPSGAAPPVRRHPPGSRRCRRRRTPGSPGRRCPAGRSAGSDPAAPGQPSAGWPQRAGVVLAVAEEVEQHLPDAFLGRPGRRRTGSSRRPSRPRRPCSPCPARAAQPAGRRRRGCAARRASGSAPFRTSSWQTC